MKAFSICLCFLVLGNTLQADAPTAADDLAVTAPNTPISIAVLDNDSDVEGNQLAVLRASAPAHGTVVINSGAVPASPELARLWQFAAIQLSNSVTQIADTNRFRRSTVITNGLWRTRSSVASLHLCPFALGLHPHLGYLCNRCLNLLLLESVQNTRECGFC